MHDPKRPLPKVLILVGIHIVPVTPMSQSINETPFIDCFVFKNLYPLTLFDILVKKPTIITNIGVIVHTFTIPFVLNHLAFVNYAVL